MAPLTNPAAVYHSGTKFRSPNGIGYIIHDTHDNLNQCLLGKWWDLIEMPRTTGTFGQETVYRHNAGQTLERWGVDAGIVNAILGDINSLFDGSPLQEQQEFNARLLTYLPKECRDDDVASMCLSTLLVIAPPHGKTGTSAVELGYAFIQTSAEIKLLPGMSPHEIATVQCVLRSSQAEWIRGTMPSAVQGWKHVDKVRDEWPMLDEYYAYEYMDEDFDE